MLGIAPEAPAAWGTVVVGHSRRCGPPTPVSLRHRTRPATRRPGRCRRRRSVGTWPASHRDGRSPPWYLRARHNPQMAWIGVAGGHVPRAHGTPSAVTEPLQGTSVLLQTRNFHATDCWHVVSVMKLGVVQGSPWPVSGAPVPFAVCNSRNCRAVSRRGGPSKSPERGIRYEVPRPENKSAIALKASFGSHSISG